jgi:hypothetical protein
MYQPSTPQWLMRIADIAADVFPYQCQNFTKHLSRSSSSSKTHLDIILDLWKIPACSFVLQYTKTYALSEEASNPLLNGPTW